MQGQGVEGGVTATYILWDSAAGFALDLFRFYPTLLPFLLRHHSVAPGVYVGRWGTGHSALDHLDTQGYVREREGGGRGL